MWQQFVVFLLAMFVARTNAQGQNLVMLMVDGFANYYLDQQQLAGFKALETNGIRAEYMQPMYPTISFPNWYSIATGLYIENHGQIGNFMYDKSTNKTFHIGTRSTDYDPHWWTQVEPIWVTAQSHGKPVSCYWWAGCQVSFPNRPAVETVEAYQGLAEPTLNLSLHLDGIVERLKTNRSNLIMLYYEDVDFSAHRFGPSSPQRTAANARISRTIMDLQREFEAAGLWNNTNLMVFSDHGMSSISRESYYFLEDCLDASQMTLIEKTVERFSMMHIFVKNPSDQQQIYDSLKACNKWPAALQVMWRWDIPEKYHLKNGRFLPDILVASTGPYANILSKTFNNVKTDMFVRGMHGYSNDDTDMRAIFFARGPCFKKGTKIGSLRTVDIYQMATAILGIPSNGHNGSWERVSNFLSSECTLDATLVSKQSALPLPYFWLSCGAFSTLISVLIVQLCHKLSK